MINLPVTAELIALEIVLDCCLAAPIKKKKQITKYTDTAVLISLFLLRKTIATKQKLRFLR